MVHGVRHRCACCRNRSDAEKATEFMEAYVLARASARPDSLDGHIAAIESKKAYLTIHKTNLEAIRKEMNR